MELDGKTIGFALCGSFCTFEKAIEALTALKSTGADIIPIMSETAYSTNTRFGESNELEGGLLFLLNEKAAGFITGVVLPIDGGFSAYSGV